MNIFRPIPDSLYKHHGIKDLPALLVQYIKDSVFIDGGAYNGDSAAVLSLYRPSKCYSFEL